MAELLYKDHRGWLSESMETVKIITSVEDIKAHLNESLKQFWREIDSIKFHHVCFDERIGRDTYNVLVQVKWEKLPYVAGQTNGIPPSKELLETLQATPEKEKAETHTTIYAGFKKTPISVNKEDLIKCWVDEKTIDNNTEELTLGKIFWHPNVNIDALDALVKPHLEQIGLNGALLNNFILRLPLVLDWKDWGETKTERISFYWEMWNQDKTFKEILTEFNKRQWKDTSETDTHGYSEKKINQTPREFFQEVTKAVKEYGEIGSPEEYEQEIQQLRQDNDNLRDKNDKEANRNRDKQADVLIRKLRPVYIALRKMGYSNKDIVA
jgi:hypothetical protein